MLERLGRRGRERSLLKNTLKLCNCCCSNFFLQFPDAPEILTLISQSSNLYFLFFFLKKKKGWVAQSVMANMPGMRSSGRAGGPGEAGSKRRERRNETVGKEGAFSPNEPGCRNICSGLVLHPGWFTREKPLPVRMERARGPSLPCARPGLAEGRGVTERGAPRRVARSPGVVKSAAGETERTRTRRGRGSRALFVRADGRCGEALCLRWGTANPLSAPQNGFPQIKPRASQRSPLRGAWGGVTKANPTRCLHRRGRGSSLSSAPPLPCRRLD